ncbi:MAG: M20/M25/M40 family metallo-hydrolase, partial [Candidatus Calescibacterium sp.]|nr:M20/M25/M40 family metallo-hydrolase [Candidatus Calescibacterium sp.]
DRKNVIAVLKGGKGYSNNAIVFLGHFDTVDIEDYGSLRDFAFDPQNLRVHMKEVYPELVADNIEFGRGILDMKAGIAVNIEVLKNLAENINDWSGYAIFLFVCDEEGDSKGMLNSLYFLEKIKNENSLNFLFCLNTDYTVKKAVYLGSIGKVLIGLLVKGLETHVGQSLEGLNSNYILCSILSKIEDNEYLIEHFENEFTNPPTVMKVRDLRESYNVKTNLYSFAYINHLFFNDGIEDIIEKYKNVAKEAVKEVIFNRKEIMKKFGMDYDLRDFRIYSLAEFVDTYGNFDHYVSYGFGDYREDLVVSLKNWLSSLKVSYPFVLIFLLPPYYPSVNSMNEIKTKIKEYIKKLDEKIEVYNYFPYISDLSFLGRVGNCGLLEKNMLGWDKYYYLDIEMINKVSMPCIDWGVLGFDAHKSTERLVVDYSLYRLPGYIKDFVLNYLV